MIPVCIARTTGVRRLGVNMPEIDLSTIQALAASYCQHQTVQLFSVISTTFQAEVDYYNYKEYLSHTMSSHPSSYIPISKAPVPFPYASSPTPIP